jgi:hypothetical protein
VRLICPEESQDPGADGHSLVIVILQLFSCVFLCVLFFGGFGISSSSLMEDGAGVSVRAGVQG